MSDGYGWQTFWKAKDHDRHISGKTVYSSTTDSQEAVDRAARGESTAERPELIYTEVMPQIQEADGGTEHGEVVCLVDGQRVSPEAPGADIDALPADLAYRSEWDYHNQLHAYRAVIPNFDEVFDESVDIPPGVVSAIKGLNLTNGPAVAYHLAKHRNEIHQFFGLSDGQIRRKIVDLSIKLATNGTGGVDPDVLPYRGYRQLRDRRR